MAAKEGREQVAKITVVGTGYVGLSNAILFAQHNEVNALEVVEEKVSLINKKNPQSWIKKSKSILRLKI